MEKTVKVRLGNYRRPITLIYKGNRIFIKSGFNRLLIDEIKAMKAPRWHGFDEPPRKLWSIENCPRNDFQLQYLQELNPYAPYDKELPELKFERPLYKHQEEMVAHALARNYCIFACEMGVGKSLSMIEVLERIESLEDHEAFYVGPKSGVKAVGRELNKWNSRIKPQMYTYERLVKIMREWPEGKPAPRVVFFDESSKIKTPTSQRSLAAMHLADAVRDEWNDRGYVVLMSGSPAPKAPTDWYWQCLSGDTLILTSEGLQTIKSLQNQECTVLVNSNKYKIKGSWRTGTREIFRVETSEGYYIDGTNDHRVLCDFDGLEYWREIKQLVEGDKLILNKNNLEWSGIGTESDGYLLGQLVGDGTVGKNKSDYYGILSFWPDDFGVLDHVKSCLGYEPKLLTHPNGSLHIKDRYITKLVREYGLTTKKNINEFLNRYSYEFYIGFISGFFDADGNVDKTRLRISLVQSNHSRLKCVQQMLIALGIRSSISKKIMPDNPKIKGKKVRLKQSYTLRIWGESACIFYDKIGFCNPRKQKILRERVAKQLHRKNYSHTATVKSIKYLRTDDVYDIEVSEVHCFSANGIIAHNCEVAQPGFIKEGNAHKFKQRLCIIQERQSITGGIYPHIITWLDDDKKCGECGEYKDVGNHTLASGDYHDFKPTKNEVKNLYKRMKGLVLVQFKKDCLDLPDKQYQIINVQPTVAILQAAKIIRKMTTRAIQTLTLLRELSDGFQYTQEKVGEKECGECYGKGTAEIPVLKEGKEITDKVNADDYEIKEVICDGCGGDGKVTLYKRGTEEVESPKDAHFIELLDDHEDVGRFIVWGGFKGTIDRLIKMCHSQGWATLRVDGRGYAGSTPTGDPIDTDELLDAMDRTNPKSQEMFDKYPKVCFVGHPQAGGMALTLTSSPSELFYSNSFNGEARIQAEDRFHRMGMDENSGATIYDMIHLPSDRLVLDNLMKKKRLQNLTMGQLEDAFASMDDGRLI